jgi:hypothetical protein
MDEFAFQMSHSIRDLNRYIKIKRDHKLYPLKDTFIKFLIRKKYIKNIENHQNLVLFTTKFDNISSHTLPHRSDKFNVDIDDLPINNNPFNKKEYTIEDIEDINKMKEDMEFTNQLNNGVFITSLSNLFNEPYVYNENPFW